MNILKRYKPKIGDYYVIPIHERNTKYYFQIVGVDEIQLGSEVIVILDKEYKMQENPTTEELDSHAMLFYTHVFVPVGVKHKVWEYSGINSKLNDRYLKEEFKFKGSSDSGELNYQLSSDWKIWKLGDKEWASVVKIPKDFVDSENDLVFTPLDVKDRIANGSYKIDWYPLFEIEE